MRPLRLRADAFGPFAESLSLDFSDLREHEFFLIQGPTGAGKTSILDAICFALCGEASGSDRRADQTRCQQAAPDHGTEVEFEFRLRGARYRAVRSPQQERPKKRGSGVTIEPERATLFEIDRDGKPRLLADSLRSVNEAVQRLLGFDCAQFRQIVVLPQGEFRKLLQSSSKDREPILKVLFRTGLYDKVTQALKDRAAALRDGAEAYERSRAAVLSQTLHATEEELRTRIVALPDLVTVAVQEAQTATQAHQKAVEAKKDAEVLLDLLKRREVVQARLQLLEKELPQREQQRRELEAAQACLALAEAERHCAKLKDGLALRETALARCAMALNKARERAELAERALTAELQRDGERTAATEAVARLEALKAVVGRYERSRVSLRDVEAALTERRTELSKVQKNLELGRAKMEKLRASLIPLKGSEARELEARQRLEDMRRLEQRWRLRENLARQERSAESALQSRTDRAAEAQRLLEETHRRLEEAEEKRRENAAHQLAQHLADGHPCPVCGSAQHPSPATAPDGVPSPAEWEALRKARETAEARLRLAEREQQTAALDLEKHRGRREAEDRELASWATMAEEEVVDHLQRAKESHAKAADAAEKEKDNAERLETGAAFLQTQEAEHARLSAAVAALTGQREEKLHQLEEDQRLLPEELRETEGFTERLVQARTTLERLQKALEAAKQAAQDAAAARTLAEADTARATQERQSADAELAQALVQFRERLAGSRFADEAAYRAARREEAQIAAFAKSLKDYDDELRSTRTSWETMGMLMTDSKPPDIAALTAACAQAEDRLRKSQEAASKLRQEQEALSRAAARLEELKAQHDAAEKEYAWVGRLAGLASGEKEFNPQRLTFQRFVLSAILDEVLAAANLRLEIMSQGRYALQRRAEGGSSVTRSGLEIEVFDAYSLQTRAVGTLSGGEGFLASLSLALGLSDVVQRESGSVQLDTIFIDEGFGTLDPESLEKALEALMELRGEGRLVGIISHVSELQEMILAHLQVEKGTRGSTARFVVR